MALQRLRRLGNTLRYLRPAQLAYYVLRRKFPASRVSFAGTADINPELQLQPPLPVDSVYRDGAFTFLNVSRPLALDAMEWSPADVQRLWRYNLHYFDYLRQADLDVAHKLRLLASWVEHNPQPSEPGWEPFTASLRIVNWVFFFRACEAGGEGIPAALVNSLYEQALWLEKNDERHILANHYFENLKALVFAGCYFNGEDARRWRARGARALQAQLQEQILADGGHYERTPQYHALMLENYLDLYNLASANPGLFAGELIGQLRQAADGALAFLEGIVFPDDGLPLFNDTAFGIAPALASLQAYATRLFERPVPQGRSSLIDYAPSGLYGYRTASDMLIVDCGDIGPAYQPGHTHCDFLSYELMLAGQRIVVDTGVCEYEPGAMRHHVRSTRAHNTVVVDGDEQSEIWGEFRVARRARKLSAAVATEEGAWNFEGAFSGFYGVKGGIRHRRGIELLLGHAGDIRQIEVTDSLEGRGEHRLESRIHLHPDVTASVQEGVILLSLDGRAVATLMPDTALEVRIEDTVYCPEFGLQLANQCVVLSQHTALPCQFGYSIHRSS